jgi:hypothetical protein
MDGIFFPFPYVGTVFCFCRHETKNQGAALHIITPRVHIINACVAYHQRPGVYIIKKYFIKYTSLMAQKEKKWRSMRRFRQI